MQTCRPEAVPTLVPRSAWLRSMSTRPTRSQRNNRRAWQPRHEDRRAEIPPEVENRSSHSESNGASSAAHAHGDSENEPNTQQQPDPWSDWRSRSNPSEQVDDGGYDDRNYGYDYEPHRSDWDDSSWDRYGSQSQGWLNNAQLRQFNTAAINRTTAVDDGRWVGSYYDLADAEGGYGWNEDGEWQPRHGEKPSERLKVPTFDGGGEDKDVGHSARSYIRRIQVWLRCTKMPLHQRALALYDALTDRAWVYAEELDVDILASDHGIPYYLEWVQTRFMDVEVTKIAQMMNDLFRKCRRRQDQSIRDFNVEFERMVLRLHEVKCTLPPLVKAWLYVDKLRLNEQEELALLASVGNEYDVRRLQHAALVQDRSLRRGGSEPWKPGGAQKPKWQRQTVHLTGIGEDSSEEDDFVAGPSHESDSDLLEEDEASAQHTAFMAYQGAKAKYKDALRGRGTDAAELEKIADARLKRAKMRSFCSVCKRRGHWHRDPECPLRNKGAPPSSTAADKGSNGTQHAEMCYTVHMVENCNPLAEDEVVSSETQNFEPAKETYTIADKSDGVPPRRSEAMKLKSKSICSACNQRGHWRQDPACPLRNSGAPSEPQDIKLAKETYPIIDEDDGVPPKQREPMLAIVDTACSKSVAGHDWFERYCAEADARGLPIELVHEEDNFKFGASRVHRSSFGVWAWFGIAGRWAAVKVAVVNCKVPLLLSRPALAQLGTNFDLASQQLSLRALDLWNLPLQQCPTGHPALVVSDFPVGQPPNLVVKPGDEVCLPAVEAYMASSGGPPKKLLFYPKKIPIEVENMLVTSPFPVASYFSWWQAASQSRDFWIEEEHQLVRVHVVPRKYKFDPSKWNTTKTSQKSQLLAMLDGQRITESTPCLSDGVVCDLDVDNFRDASDVSTCTAHGLWIGRSRFSKRSNHAALTATHGDVQQARTSLAMEDEQGGVDVRTAGEGGTVPPNMDGARAEIHLAGSAKQQSYQQGPHRESSAGHHEAVAPRADPKGPRREFGHQPETNPRSSDPPVEGSNFGPRRDGDPLRQVQGLAVQGAASGLHVLGSGRSASKGASRLPSRSGGVGELGPEAFGVHQGDNQGQSKEHGSRPGSDGEDQGSDGGGLGSFQHIKRLESCVKPAPQKASQEQSGEEVTSESRMVGGRDGGGNRRSSYTDRHAGSKVGSSEEEAGEVVSEDEASNYVLFTEDIPAGFYGISEADPDSVDIGCVDQMKHDKHLEAQGNYETDYNNGKAAYMTESLFGNFLKSKESEAINPGEGMSPKQRARRGMMRRRRMNESTGKQLKRHATSLMKVFMACTCAFTSWAHEVAGEPLQDAWAVFQSKHAVAPSSSSLPRPTRIAWSSLPVNQEYLKLLHERGEPFCNREIFVLAMTCACKAPEMKSSRTSG